MLSPLVLLALLGAAYVGIQMLNGIGAMAAVQAFLGFINNLMPYFPYLTTVPAALIVLMLLLKKYKHTRTS